MLDSYVYDESIEETITELVVSPMENMAMIIILVFFISFAAVGIFACLYIGSIGGAAHFIALQIVTINGLKGWHEFAYKRIPNPICKTTYRPCKKIKTDTIPPVPVVPEIAVYPAWNGDIHTLPIAQYVYIIQDIEVSGLCKIGKTNKPSRRLNRFDVMLPFQHSIIHIIPCQNMHALERGLHNRFAPKRIRGEWFALTPNDVDYIKSL